MSPSNQMGFFMNGSIIPPENQMIILNRHLINNAHQLPSPVITVGGQAVMYWYATYMHAYPEQPDMIYITSQDVDYVAKKESVEIIARIFNVEGKVQEVFHPPSIAVLNLIDIDTGRVKEDKQGQFLNQQLNEANVVDIIDRPSGFDSDDFTGDKLLLNTEVFLVMPEQHGAVISHEMVRVLNPIATIRSRLANATAPMGKDKLTEVERIKVLALPAYNFMLQKIETLPFKESRKWIDYYCSMIWQQEYRRFQAEYNIPLYVIVEQLLMELSESPEEYDIPEAFYTKELPRKIAYLEKEYRRITGQMQISRSGL